MQVASEPDSGSHPPTRTQDLLLLLAFGGQASVGPESFLPCRPGTLPTLAEWGHLTSELQGIHSSGPKSQSSVKEVGDLGQTRQGQMPALQSSPELFPSSGLSLPTCKGRVETHTLCRLFLT